MTPPRHTPDARRHLRRALAALPLALGRATAALAQGTDTLPATSAEQRHPEPLFTRRDAIALGGAMMGAALVSTLDRGARDALRRPALQENHALARTARTAKLFNERSLFAAEMGTWAVARLAGGHRAADVAFHAAEAVFVSSAGETVIRGILGRSRPFVTKGGDPYDFHAGKGFGGLAYRSFPSIHASASMATAVVLSRELAHDHPRAARVATPVLVGAAFLPGLARMYADKHWASDVVAGLLLGAWTGDKVVKWQHTRPGNRLDRWMLGRGASVTWQF